MDSEIFQLLKPLSHRGLDNLTSEEKRIKLWNRCVVKWNKTHSTTKVPLSALADELYLKWPQMYVSLSRDELYCSFSYEDYIFHNNGNGQICGGMFIRGGEMPTGAINMTASQIVDLIGIIRPMPSLGRIITQEAYENLIDRDDDRCSGCSDPSQTALAWADRAWNLYHIGLIEDALVACTNSIIHKCIASEGGRMGALEAEIYMLMGRIYYFTYQWDLADYCFKESYNQYYKIFERPDWKDVLYADVPEEEREEYDDNIIGSYLNWANSYSIFLRDIGNESGSKAIQERYHTVMNREQSNREDYLFWMNRRTLCQRNSK